MGVEESEPIPTATFVKGKNSEQRSVEKVKIHFFNRKLFQNFHNGPPLMNFNIKNIGGLKNPETESLSSTIFHFTGIAECLHSSPQNSLSLKLFPSTM
mmetsp:Transcript_7078/g.11631  ORF Transcript_7078/g.11631 Transcript_7078/m.11631 type:complete len:98 (+) Transcript_7078:266-559(+)